MKLNNEQKLENFLITIHNAYFQSEDLSNFTGIHEKPGELALLLKDDNYTYSPLIVMLVLIDILGGLICDKKGIENRFYCFIENYLKPLNKNYSECKKGLFYCRNLLVHNWTGKSKVSLSKGKKGKHLEYDKGIFCINLDFLFNNLREAFQNLKTNIENNSNVRNKVIKNLRQPYFDKLIK